MNPYDVIWFANHKYGELAYIYLMGNEIKILTAKSKWRIFVDSLNNKKFELYHLNYLTDNLNYHKQGSSHNLDFLIYYAFMHDYDTLPYGKKEWKEFKRLWEMYKLGREIEESIAIFNFLSQD